MKHTFPVIILHPYGPQLHFPLSPPPPPRVARACDWFLHYKKFVLQFKLVVWCCLMSLWNCFLVFVFLKQFIKDQWKFYWYMIYIFIGELQKVINCFDSSQQNHQHNNSLVFYRRNHQSHKNIADNNIHLNFIGNIHQWIWSQILVDLFCKDRIK